MPGRIFAAAVVVLIAGCTSDSGAGASAGDSAAVSASDSAFRSMDHRHGEVVGVDPSSLSHRFVTTSDGGDVILERKAGDSVTTVKQIHAHLASIARAFTTGDFSTPALIHERQADGADVMARKAEVIIYFVQDTTNGSILRIRTTDREALEGIHRFIAFQTREHRTGG